MVTVKKVFSNVSAPVRQVAQKEYPAHESSPKAEMALVARNGRAGTVILDRQPDSTIEYGACLDQSTLQRERMSLAYR